MANPPAWEWHPKPACVRAFKQRNGDLLYPTRGGGTSTSNPRDTATSRHTSTVPTGDNAGTRSAHNPITGHSGTQCVRCRLIPLHDNADNVGPAQVPSAPSLLAGFVQTSPRPHARSLAPPCSPQHASAAATASDSPHSGRAGGLPHPSFNSALIPSTHSTQCADPASAAFAAAIHCSSVNLTPAGGRTPFRIAHTSRSCSLWQQQCDQHSAADPHPHPHPSHGYRSAYTLHIHRLTNAADGTNPSVHARCAHTNTAATTANHTGWRENHRTGPDYCRHAGCFLL